MHECGYVYGCIWASVVYIFLFMRACMQMCAVTIMRDTDTMPMRDPRCISDGNAMEAWNGHAL